MNTDTNQRTLDVFCETVRRMNLSQEVLSRPIFTGPSLAEVIFDMAQSHGERLSSEGLGTLGEWISQWIFGYGQGRAEAKAIGQNEASRYYDKLQEERTTADFDDPGLCSACGGKCCRIYARASEGGTMPESQDYDEWLSKFHHDKDLYGVAPLFTPPALEGDSFQAQLQRQQIREQGYDPQQCEYCGPSGCIIERDRRPHQCRAFRCSTWVLAASADHT